MYFTFISILTVGFGDFRPSEHNIWTTLAVVLGGVILTTMCMDVVGRMYLKEIHYLGRKLKSNNPFYLIREAKARHATPSSYGVIASSVGSRDDFRPQGLQRTISEEVKEEEGETKGKSCP
ncbi:hypothetical protein OESDEN_22262 [Oesophagostomum dentatum]|uniref:Potassium channel domain-containing protein n=1 Tax=Oesophagostomum dentatum TaxID=61180 RepID=A0A0B1RYG8_OESDE|nr:hypothetical protein OESDEN_22262 [Oesophagostomum dentatum]